MKISLKAARVNAGFTIRQAAEVMERDKNTIVHWEKGRLNISESDFRKLCLLYNMKPEYIDLERVEGKE